MKTTLDYVTTADSSICEQGQAFCNKYPDPKDAWANCNNPNFLLWWLCLTVKDEEKRKILLDKLLKNSVLLWNIQKASLIDWVSMAHREYRIGDCFCGATFKRKRQCADIIRSIVPNPLEI